jgi:hypothetical protein
MARFLHEGAINFAAAPPASVRQLRSANRKYFRQIRGIPLRTRLRPDMSFLAQSRERSTGVLDFRQIFLLAMATDRRVLQAAGKLSHVCLSRRPFGIGRKIRPWAGARD